MKKFFLFLILFLFTVSSNLFAEYRLEPVNCTIKKKDNCGAYLYNSNTGSTYFCTSTKCSEILEALEEFGGEEVKKEAGSKKSLKSKIPKFKKKEKKKSKIPKFKKSN
tara:strand:- start:506 stop:829 length:324 start_codon:yes stop_codon:yes gene_type:complete